MKIIGINAFHGDSSACLVVDGVLICAAEEERFRRVKHWAGFPSESIKFCLEYSGLTLSDISHIAINQNSKSSLYQKLLYLIKKRPNLTLISERLRSRKDRKGIRQHLLEKIGNGFVGKFVEVDHHLAHLYSSFLASPFDDAVVVSVDGFGDFASTAWGLGSGQSINLQKKIYFPHSLGIFYQAITQWLGFKNYGDEYKVMGLAPYGAPTYISEMSKIVLLRRDGTFKLNLKYFVHQIKKILLEWQGGTPLFDNLYSDELIKLIGSPRAPGDELTQKHKDIAKSAQEMYEVALFNLLNQLHAKYGNDRLCLAGGCSMNSVANGKILEKTPFKKLYIQPAPGDAGGAIGAAFSLQSLESSKDKQLTMKHAYWGPSYDDKEIMKAILSCEESLLSEKCTVEKFEDFNLLSSRVAKHIASGAVVGWFQGRMEWGPRALGNRSILVDPRRQDMQDILNLKIKRRESFRPFAPSILEDLASDWFDVSAAVPFMSEVYPVRMEKRVVIPAVTHIDGSGRLQSVSRDSNPRFYILIDEFYKLTGVPLLVNTSFNENEPIVCTPNEALNCFIRTKMDILVLGDNLISRCPS